MRFRFTEEQEALRERVRAFAEAEVAPATRAMEESDSFPRALVDAMGRAGLLGLPVSAVWGGSGCDMVSYMLAIEEISRVSAAVGVILAVHTSVGTLPIVYHGTDEQKRRCLPRLASGAWLGAFALTEPHAGSDASTIRTAAARSGDDYVLTGSKVFITNAGEADQYLLFAVVPPMKGAPAQGGASTRPADADRRGGGITAFLVAKDTPGLVVGRKEKKMGLAAPTPARSSWRKRASRRRSGSARRGTASASRNRP